MKYRQLKAMDMVSLLDVVADRDDPDGLMCRDQVLKRLPCWNGNLLGSTALQRYTLRVVIMDSDRALAEAEDKLRTALGDLR